MKKKLNSVNEEKISTPYYLWIVFRLNISKILKRNKNFRDRRPHRSFMLTKRRDYKRPLFLPGYIKFTQQVLAEIRKNKNTFILLIILLFVLNIIFIGLLDQEFISNLTEVLNETSGELFSGGFGEIGKAGLLLISTITSGGLNQNPNEGQQIIIIFTMLFAWLCIVFILRDSLAGKNNIKLRDALYRCGSPIISTGIVCAIMLIQLLPVMLAVIAYSSAVATQFLAGGVETMIFMVVALLLVSISVYWIIGSFLALIVSTLPGMYPMNAIRIAGNMVVGRRLRIIYRVLWCVLVSIVIWAIFMIPIILITGWLGSAFEILNSIPIVPIFMLIVSSFVTVFVSSYIYMLYREIVDNDSQQL